ncbi:MOS1T transposase, partial [Pseudoatta argentina]
MLSEAYDKKRSGQPKKFEDEEVEALLEVDQDPSQTQEELAKSLNVDRSTISKHLKAIGMIQKQGNYVLYELKPRDVKRRKITCELLLQRHRRKKQRFHSYENTKKWVDSWITSKDVSFFRGGIHLLLKRCNEKK